MTVDMVLKFDEQENYVNFNKMEVPNILKYKYRIVAIDGYHETKYKIQIKKPKSKFISWLFNSHPYRWVDYKERATWEGVPETITFTTQEEARDRVEGLKLYDEVKRFKSSKRVIEYIE